MSRTAPLAALLWLATMPMAPAKDLPEPADNALDHLEPGVIQAFHVQWGKGDRGGESVDVMYQFQDDRKGFVHARETHFAGLTSVEVIDRKAALTEADIRKVRASVQANDFWTITEQDGQIIRDNNGAESILICWNAMTLSGIEQGRRHGVEARCPSPEHSMRAYRFGQTLLAVARSHVPDFARNPAYWDQN